MVKKGSPKKPPSHRDLVKTVSKQLKYYFEIRRQEDGFDLSGPECPRPDYPCLKSRPMLLYEGLHDRSVKHFYSHPTVKQKITHMDTEDAPTSEAKRMQKLMKKTMDRVTYVPPWMGVGAQGGSTKYSKNSDKYITGTLGEWSTKPRQVKRKGYGNPEPTMAKAFSEPSHAKPRMRRSCPSGWIDNKECKRLVNGASRILASYEFREDRSSRPQSSTASSRRSSRRSEARTRSASPNRKDSLTVSASTSSSQYRLTHRPQSGRNTLQREDNSYKLSYHDAKDQVVRDHEEKKTSDNLKKGKIYYDIDGRRKPVPHRVKNEEEYLERRDSAPLTGQGPEAEEGKVPDWLKNQMRRQDVQEKKMPYNQSVRSVEISEPNTARSEDVSKREGVRLRPKSAKRTGKHSGQDRDAESHVTLSEGSFEEVNIDESESEESEDAYYEDRGCQTGWELFVQYDQSENVLYDGETESALYKIVVKTGSAIGASIKVPVHVVLFGNRGRSPELLLEKCENHKVPFQQNATDIFHVRCSFVGSLKKVEIGHDSENESWFLDSVSVYDKHRQEVYEFLCKKWLAVMSDDKMTRRELSVSAFRKLEKDDDEKEEEEDLDDGEDAGAIETVTKINSPRHSTVSGSHSSAVSSTHLRNGTTQSSESRNEAGVSLPSDSSTAPSLPPSDRKQVLKQEPFAVQSSGKTREPRGRRSPSNIEDFESDVTLHSAKRSTGSRRSESTLTGSDDHTAIFEEQSVLSQNTSTDQDRLEAFKAGQRAERERQRLEQDKAKQQETLHTNDITKGPTIHQAAKSGNITRVKELLDHNRELQDAVDDRGDTALHLASNHGNKDVVQFLAATGAALDIRDQAGYEPCHRAAMHGHVNCLMVLVAMGASINSQTDDNKTPLHLAAMSGNMETCRWLVANRARLNVEDDFGRTPVDMAENNGHDDIASFLRTCINNLEGKRTSLESLLIGGKDEDSSWMDDKERRSVSRHRDDDESDSDSVADLRKESRIKEEKEAKQKAYADMQRKLSSGNMTLLDSIRYEVDNS